MPLIMRSMRLACGVVRCLPRPRRLRSFAVSTPLRDMRVVRKEIDLTPSEQDLFEILRQTNEHYRLGVTLRCAGGWVRDKLLGRNSDDIDIAIDTMLGATFAEKVSQFITL